MGIGIGMGMGMGMGIRHGHMAYGIWQTGWAYGKGMQQQHLA
jgi:hypothetical protein